MTVYIEKPAVNLREELASLRNQGGYQEQQFYFDGLVTNGTFDTDLTGWTNTSGAWSAGGGLASVTTTTGVADLDTNVPTTVGKAYLIIADVTVTAGSILIRRVSPNTATAYSSVSGQLSIAFVAGSTSTPIGTRANTNTQATIDSISVFELDANDDVIHTMPKGWKPKDVFEDGLLQREGAAHDYEVVYDGFDYIIKPTVAPSATTQTCVIGVKA